MRFEAALALLVGLLVAAPLAAHLFRRRRAEEIAFPPAALVSASPPVARRRSQLEDRALFSVRALAVLALALLGASPFVRCDRLTLARRGGASVALAVVVDDSLSMQAPAAGSSESRFERARRSARELARALEPGDAIAIVLAGKPARVVLATTGDRGVALAALDGLGPTERATDLDGALRLATELLRGAPQTDRRVVLFSDLADGRGAPAALPPDADARLWVPVPELAGPVRDCAVIRASRFASKVRVRVACSGDDGAPVPPNDATWRARGVDLISAVDGRPLGSETLARATEAGDLVLDVPEGAPERLDVRLSPGDAIASDDRGSVVAQAGASAIALLADPVRSGVETGGPTLAEHALSALELGTQIKPLTAPPERADELDGVAALLVDDAPGLTPESRRAVGAWLERGGVALVALGPAAAAAPLGASFEPMVRGVARWTKDGVPDGVEPGSAAWLGPAASTLESLAAEGRTLFEPAALAGAEVLARWTDGEPLLFRVPVGRGSALVVGLPLSAAESDLPFRPAFLALLERFVLAARARGGDAEVEAGGAWVLSGVARAEIARAGSAERVGTVTREGERVRVVPDRAGRVQLVVDGDRTERVVTVPAEELDTRARAPSADAGSGDLGGRSAQIDLSPWIALALLALLAAELVLRLWVRPREEAHDAGAPPA